MNKNLSNQIKLQEALKGAIKKNPEASNEIKNMLNSLNEEDIKKISEVLKNEDIAKLASAFLKKE